MISISGLRPTIGCHLGSWLAFVLAMVAVGLSGPGGGRALAAQAANPCALLTSDDLESLASNASIADGVSTSLEAIGRSACRYTWGVGTGRFNLEVVVSDASRMFAGKSPDLIKQELQASVTAGTADAVITDVGEAAVFKADSPAYAHTTAFLKGRILQVYLDGFDAREQKDSLIDLLKLAASRL